MYVVPQIHLFCEPGKVPRRLDNVGHNKIHLSSSFQTERFHGKQQVFGRRCPITTGRPRGVTTTARARTRRAIVVDTHCSKSFFNASTILNRLQARKRWIVLHIGMLDVYLSLATYTPKRKVNSHGDSCNNENNAHSEPFRPFSNNDNDSNNSNGSIGNSNNINQSLTVSGRKLLIGGDTWALASEYVPGTRCHRKTSSFRIRFSASRVSRVDMNGGV